ncbi:MAG: coenzyme F420-0:L-glutamate ligase [Rhizobiales bacterium]|nr:coenzyme F420-0:L-glutamate ligase [Hyphomicrobiales bacterium]
MSADKSQEVLTLIPLRGVPLVQPGDDLPGIIIHALAESNTALQPRDVLILAQKIVSKAEGRIVDLKTVTPSTRAVALAHATAKDPRVVELILAESTEILRQRPGAIIVAHRLGYVLANAGIDMSNVGPDGEERALLLPADPDRSCRELRERLRERTGADAAVLVIDSFGRAWRNGTVGTAIGVSGFPALADLRGKLDLFGRPLQITEVGLADELAAAASLLMGQAAEGAPVVLARGVPYERRESGIQELLRPKAQDLFR